jgi:diketogulonate reductase-like aldo/keto reductase
MVLLRPLLHTSSYEPAYRWATSIVRVTIRRRMASNTANERVSRLHDDQPAFIYGTAWKKDQTKRLVKEALAAGFRRVDTAAQPRHYQEDLVGEALRESYQDGIVSRNDVYVSDGIIDEECYH